MALKVLFVFVISVFCSQTFAQAEVSEVLFETFRGNSARNSVGLGTLPVEPSIKWRYPENKRMCGNTKVSGRVVKWCGSGWTGQPVAYKNTQGDQIVAFGAYDHGIHFLNAETGKERYPTFFTKDIIKGSGTISSNGLYSIGSRDNKLRVLRLSADKVEELWSFDGNIKGGIWNNDWDASPLLFEDYLIAGGENSWLFIFKLNKKMVNGQITINPEEVVRIPGFDKELLKLAGNRNVSIENSVVLFEDRIYFANSGGMIWGYNFRKLIENPKNIKDALVLKFWAGDDIDATMTVDEQGMLYAGVELEKVSDKYSKARARAKKSRANH